MTAEYLFKIVAVGSGGVGKTSLIRRFAEGKFSESYLPTLGVDITTKIIDFGERGMVKLICVDTAGQEYFGRLRPTYYRGANGAMVVFDLTKEKTFTAVPKWLNELKPNVRGDIPLVLIGNKEDLIDQRDISDDLIEKFAKEHNMPFFLTSAKAGKNVNAIFSYLAEAILTFFEQKE
ncbi:MAG: Rab family GTPase [Promethearchaeota archaeon]